jgi:hypothetical protein
MEQGELSSTREVPSASGYGRTKTSPSRRRPWQLGSKTPPGPPSTVATRLLFCTICYLLLAFVKKKKAPCRWVIINLANPFVVHDRGLAAGGPKWAIRATSGHLEKSRGGVVFFGLQRPPLDLVSIARTRESVICGCAVARSTAHRAQAHISTVPSATRASQHRHPSCQTEGRRRAVSAGCRATAG